MNRFFAASLCLLLAAGCGGSESDAPKKAGETAPANDITFVSGGTLIPGDGSQPIPKATMIVENGIIKQIGKEKELFAPKGALSVDAEGRFIVPLMVNLNGYPGLSSAQDFGAKVYKRESLTADLSRYGYYGVAAVVAGGDSDGLAFQVRDEQRAGKTPGAQLHSSGRGIAAKGASGILGSLPILVGTADEARKAVSELADRKSDAIVLWANGMKADAAAAVIDEAHKRMLKVFASASDLADAKAVVKAGADALIASVTDKDVDDEFIALMKEKKVSLAPALTSIEAKFVYADGPKWLGEQAMREAYPSALSAYLADPVVVARFKRSGDLGGNRQAFATASKNLKKLADGGVTIAFGSGSGLPDTFPGYFEHREMELMVAAGLAPMDVIKAASASSAEALGAKELGALAAGKKANFMVLSSSPLEDIKNTKQIDQVFVAGHDVDRLEMIRNAKVEVKKVTNADRQQEAAFQQQEAEAAAEAKLPHYGKFVLGPSIAVGPGLTIQTPKRSKGSASFGPPYKVTVSLSGASGEDLRGFYAAVFARGWTAAGGCWEKANPLEEGKKFRACPEPASGQITLNIAVQ